MQGTIFPGVYGKRVDEAASSVPTTFCRIPFSKKTVQVRETFFFCEIIRKPVLKFPLDATFRGTGDFQGGYMSFQGRKPKSGIFTEQLKTF